MTQRMADLLPKILQQAKTQHEAIAMLQQQWPRMVGRELAGQSRPVSLRRGRLTIHVQDAGTHFALSLRLPALRQQAQRRSGGRVTELVIRAGTIEQGGG